MKKTWILLGLAAVAGLAFVVPWSRPEQVAQAASSDLYTVRRADLEVTITESGTMVAKESQKVAAKIKGESKILSLTEEGKEVAEGEVVCKLDGTQAQSAVEQVKLDILQTEADLKTARTEIEIQEVENAANLTKASVALDRAKKEIEKYRDGEAPQERRKLEVTLKDMETEFNRARKNLEDSTKLLEQNYIKKSELEDHQIAFERATVQKDSAEVALRMFDKYTFPMTLRDFETKLADAEREVSTAQKRGESQLGQKSVRVQQLEKRLRMQTDQLKERQEDLDNMVLKAPCPGILVYGNPHEPWYRDRIKVGGSVYGGQTVMTVPDLRMMQVKLKIHEADISKLKLGQKGLVTTDSYPGVRLDGEVTKIATVASQGEDWGGSSEVKKFDVEVTIKEPGIQLRPGISAKVEIHIEKRPKTLFVPLQAVFTEEGEHFCHTQLPGKPYERRKVDLGSSNDNWMEIVAGLTEGENVLLYNPTLANPGARKTKADGVVEDGKEASAGGAVEASSAPSAAAAVPAAASGTTKSGS